MPSRRAFVASVAAAATTLAGCAGIGDDRPTGDSPPSTEPTTSAAPTTGPTTVDDPAVRATIVDEFGAYDSIRVLPEGLRTLLLDAAHDDEAVRGHYPMLVNQPPSPDLAAFETVELRNTDGVDGTYSVDVQAGGRYRMQFDAAPAESVPDDATVVDGSELTGAQREFVRSATGSDSAEVYPETELGTWARTVLDEGYVRLDGEVYAGRERQQTDAEFFADRVWYVLSLEPTDAADPPVLDCEPVESGLAEAVAGVLEDDQGEPRLVEGPSYALVQLASETDAVMLHNLTLRLSVE
ncbi:hypothetical protein [Haloarchaeobius litoreus]|uniref:DUF7979 domain-containing protein n=1 Tax=Haloarchaeobius litoreus TaxID=755306 RepID=A0ABD6DEC8_9EURY|nr:hypothetical protein [Haloarchaeobius litoreus]